MDSSPAIKRRLCIHDTGSKCGFWSHGNELWCLFCRAGATKESDSRGTAVVASRPLGIGFPTNYWVFPIPSRKCGESLMEFCRFHLYMFLSYLQPENIAALSSRQEHHFATPPWLWDFKAWFPFMHIYWIRIFAQKETDSTPTHYVPTPNTPTTSIPTTSTPTPNSYTSINTNI